MLINVDNTETSKSFRRSIHSVLAFGLCVSDRPPLLSCVRYWVLVEAAMNFVEVEDCGKHADLYILDDREG